MTTAKTDAQRKKDAEAAQARQAAASGQGSSAVSSTNGSAIDFSSVGGDAKALRYQSTYGVPVSMLNQPVLYDVNVLAGDTSGRISPTGAPTIGVRPSTLSVSDALDRVENLDAPHLAALQTQLVAAGYLSKQGRTDNVVTGVLDDDTRKAYAQWVIDGVVSSSQGVTMQQLLQAKSQNPNANVHALTNEIATGIVGGGNVYNTDLTNPLDVKAVANRVGVAVLGRKPTDAETAKITGALQSKESAYQGTKNQAAEAKSRSVFDARVANEQANAAARAGAANQAAGVNTGAVTAGSADVVGTITRVANELGVDPHLAIAVAQQESGLNPHSEGDHTASGRPTSFGLYQLHEGGELGSLSPQQAFDPETNARVALAQVAAVARAHPGWSPGQIAAAAQRPADPVGYAKSVDGLYGKAPAVVGSGAGGFVPSAVTTVPSTYLAPTTVTAVAPPSAQALAEQQLRTDNPGEAGAHDVADTFAEFLKLIGSH